MIPHFSHDIHNRRTLKTPDCCELFAGQHRTIPAYRLRRRNFGVALEFLANANQAKAHRGEHTVDSKLDQEIDAGQTKHHKYKRVLISTFTIPMDQ